MGSSMLSPYPLSFSLPLVMKDRGYRNWAELPPELTSSILLQLGAFEILENAQKVCKSWYRVCKDPSMWRTIDMRRDFGIIRKDIKIIYSLETIYRHAVDRSHGGLVEIDIWFSITDSLLNYMADRSSNLRKLRVELCFVFVLSTEGFMETVVKLPLLEDLEVSYYLDLSGESLKVIGKSCPNLKTLKLNSFSTKSSDDEFAIAIAETMPELRHLELLHNKLTNTGLKAILDACPHLEHLDLRKCSNINLVGDLKMRCSERIRVLRLPYDE